MYQYKQELENYFQIIDEKSNALVNFKKLLFSVEVI